MRPAKIDTREDQLAALLRAGVPHAAIDAATTLLDDRERIGAARYNAERRAEELKAADAAAAAALRDVMTATDAAIDAETRAALETEDRARAARASDRRQLRDVVDIDLLRTTDDPADVWRLVQDADRAGATLGAEARAVAGQRARVEAMREQKRHLAGSGPWFRLLCAVRTTTGRAGSHDLAERGALRKKEQRQLVAQTAQVVGVRIDARLYAPPPVPAAKPTTTAGGFFDKFPQLNRG